MNSWNIHNPRKPITIYDLVLLIFSSWDKSATRTNIKSVFRCTGIHPLDNSIFDELDFASAIVDDRPLSHVDEIPSTSSTQLIQLPTVSIILVISPEQVCPFSKVK